MKLRKWDIAWAGLDPSQGHEQAGRRPALVFCHETISAAIRLAAILPLTSLKEGRRIYPTEVLLPAAATGLPAASLALCHQIRTISTSRLSPSRGRLEDDVLRLEIEKAVRLWLDLASGGEATRMSP